MAKGIAMESHRNVNYVSRLFQPQNFVPKDSQLRKEDGLSKSQKVALFIYCNCTGSCLSIHKLITLKIFGTQRSMIMGKVALHS